MRAIIFSGPSLPPASIPAQSGIEWRPPLRQGDLHRAALEGPTALGVIDGYFETTPTVWHDEILFALDRGIAVYGAASIGALRAAELDMFGMRGIGTVYQWFRDGILQDDDEVAVLNAPPELDFVPLTEPMVNIRATVGNAVFTGSISAEAGELTITAAKSIFFKQRTWDSVFAKLGEKLSQEEAAGLRRAVRDHYVDQKRVDAVLLFKAVQRST